MPRVSVIIPTYNRANLLGEAVASVLAQTYKDYEIIIVDDGSTDNTQEVASHFPPGIIKYVLQKNQGVSAARNKGIDLTQGEFLCFLDSDDALLENALEKTVSFLDIHPEIGFCYGQVYKMDENGRLLKLRRLRGARTTRVRESSEQIERLLFRGDIGILAALTRRSCFEKVGCFNTSLRVGEDIDMWLRISLRYPVGYIAEPVGKVRIHTANATTQGKFEALEKSQTDFVKMALENLDDITNFKRIKRKAYFGLYCYLSGEAARKNRLASGIKYFVKALKVYPELAFQGEGFSFLVAAARGFLPRELLVFGKQTLVALKLR
jgi:glycosyltransferase involved in cell wall biosynthesis